jgi:hypothetical protein
VVVHLSPVMVEHAPAPIGGHGAVEHHERAWREEGVARVLFGPDDEGERNFVVFGISLMALLATSTLSRTCILCGFMVQLGGFV